MKKIEKSELITDSAVLIVDDIPENLQVLGNILSAYGLDIGVATDGIHALENVKFQKPDLILLDIMMPGMDGFEVCEKLKSDPETVDIPVIFLTAKSQTEDIVKGFEVGAVDYVTKPFNSSELLVRVFNHLELKKAKDKIEAQNKELSELNAAKDKFFSIMSHDLRGPFSGLLGLSGLIISEDEDIEKSEIIELVKRINESLKSQYKLLENLLSWGGMQVNRVQPEPGKVSINQLAKDVCLSLKQNAEMKNINLICDFDFDYFVYADKNMLRTIVQNLVSNALKFTKENGNIIISAKYDEDDLVSVSVKDNGIGMTDEVREKLFRLDVHHTTLGTNNERGTGLGLILCKEMVERNGGTIKVYSEVGKGSEFIFSLPQFKDEK